MWLNWIHCAFRFVECELAQYDVNALATHTQNTQLQSTTSTQSVIHLFVLKDVWKSKILCDAFAPSTCIVSNSVWPPKLHYHVAITHPNPRVYMHVTIRHHTVISLWLFDIALHSARCFIISFSLFHFPIIRFHCAVVWFCIENWNASKCQWMEHRCNVKMYNQIKLWKSLSKIIVSRVEGCSPFAFGLYASVVSQPMDRACCTFQMVDDFVETKSNTQCACVVYIERITLFHTAFQLKVSSRNANIRVTSTIQTLATAPYKRLLRPLLSHHGISLSKNYARKG